MEHRAPVYTVSEVTRMIKDLIRGDPRLRGLWVAGELSNFKHHRSGHMYFTIKDSSASLRCVFFRRDNLHCRFQPADGMEVLLYGSISVYEPGGIYQLYVTEMEPAGMGSLYLAFEQLKKKLQEEGLFREEHKKKLPFLPRRIAVITSPTGAALQDILTTMRQRFPYTRVLVVESLMQGSDAPADVVRALGRVNAMEGIDLVIIARGGGSLEDLAPFNTEEVARAIFLSRIPVISAIGHETDFTIADFVADLRAATPTAAAAAALPRYDELIRQLDGLVERIAQALQQRLLQEKQLLDYTVTARFYRRPLERVRRYREQREALEERLRRAALHYLRLKGMELAALGDKLEGASPLRLMARGYSYCQDEEGKVIRSVRQLEVGQRLLLHFQDGSARCRTEKLEEGLPLVPNRE
ncbi:MAG TPA: exodeoxyribonuclease VII large subunit [Bacillota bacterium]|nr:exodeoxyribonuclease VII large subunit [Bacillota bacterium]